MARRLHSIRAMNAKLSRAWTTCFSEGQLQLIEVEVLVRSGLPRFDIIGLPENMIREGRDRILAALTMLGLDVGSRRILVSLNPGNIPKEGSHFDLPILAAILGALVPEVPQGTHDFFWGELGLDGRVRSEPDILAHCLFATRFDPTRLVAQLSDNTPQELSKFLGQSPISIDHIQKLFALSPTSEKSTQTQLDLDASVLANWIEMGPKNTLWDKLQGSESQFLFAALISLGRHHLLLEGPPGVGKSTWCLALRELQRPLSTGDWFERLTYQPGTSHDITNLADLSLPPFEMPHHSASRAALIGGGSGHVTIGAMTRAHRGILFLDELPEFSRDVLESLREPLDGKKIRIARKGQTKTLPADIQILATMNPCACGRFGSRDLCICPAAAFHRYRSRISLPLRERFHAKLPWKFIPSIPNSKWACRNIRKRLSEALKNHKTCVADIQLPKFPNPRQQMRWLELFESFCRWEGITKASTSNLMSFQNLLKEVHYYDECRNQNDASEHRGGSRNYGIEIAGGHLVP